MGIAERRENEVKSMKQSILDAAMELFIDQGYENVSIRKIAAKISYSPGTIYLYFKEKSEILYALQEIGLGKLFEKQLSVQNIEDPFDRLKAHARAYIDFAFQNHEYYELMFISTACLNIMNDKTEWESSNRSLRILVNNVIQCQEIGYFPNRDPRQVAFYLWSLVHGVASLEICRNVLLLKRHGFSIEETIDSVIDMLEFFKK
ncbi:MAG: TetR/AcrR family transcriptional regulator [Candidatus Kapabacteria bacterium]|nr:TetR/AcrR family transcriptional regulator [Candidatus Kapabacteria bacterium]